MGMYRRFGKERSETVFRFASVVSRPACVAVKTWSELAALDEGCDRIRRPGPSRRGLELVVGRWSRGTSSLGSSTSGVLIMLKGRCLEDTCREIHGPSETGEQ